MKASAAYSLAIERNRAGYALVWCLELPGCGALISPGGEPTASAALAIADFVGWSHLRSAKHAQVPTESLSVVQNLESGAAVQDGVTTAFFFHDGGAPSPREFPLWANCHDLALDQFRELVGSLPDLVFDGQLAGGSRDQVLAEAVAAEQSLAFKLRPLGNRKAPSLIEAHSWLQQAVCDVDPGLRVHREADTEGGLPEEWSVRKVMRRSIWELRYRSARLRAAANRIWLP